MRGGGHDATMAYPLAIGFRALSRFTLALVTDIHEFRFKIKLYISTSIRKTFDFIGLNWIRTMSRTCKLSNHLLSFELTQKGNNYFQMPGRNSNC